MQGEMSEGRRGVGWLSWPSQVGGRGYETFVRFAQFVYTGDYSIPRMIVRSNEQPLSPGTINDEAIPPPEEPQESESLGRNAILFLYQLLSGHSVLSIILSLTLDLI